MGGRGGASPATVRTQGTRTITASRLASDINPTITGQRTYEASFEWNGQTYKETRTTERAYTHASVVGRADGTGTPYIASFHASEALAAKGTLTGLQRRNGSRVIRTIALNVIKSNKKAS